MAKDVMFYRKKLPSGLTVLFEKRGGPVVATSASVLFGAQHESTDMKGISHFIEHLVFKGTKTRSVTDISTAIEDKGGVLNAFTSEEVTSFWNKLPREHFATGASIVRDLTTSPVFESKALERERQVILEEIKMYHDNPASYVLDKVKALLYAPPFGISIAGTMESVSALTRERVVSLFREVYSAHTMIFAVVGNTSWSSVLEEARAFRKRPSTITTPPIVLRSGESIEKRKGLQQAHMVLGFHAPLATDKKRYASELLDSILGGGMSSRLFQEIREKRGLGYAVKTHLEQSRDYSYGIAYIGTTPDNVTTCRNIVLKEIKKLRFLTQRELSAAKEKLIGLQQLSKEKADGTMASLLQEEIAGDASHYYDYEKNISSVRLKDVQALSALKDYSFAALVPG